MVHYVHTYDSIVYMYTRMPPHGYADWRIVIITCFIRTLPSFVCRLRRYEGIIYDVRACIYYCFPYFFSGINLVHK